MPLYTQKDLSTEQNLALIRKSCEEACERLYPTGFPSFYEDEPNGEEVPEHERLDMSRQAFVKRLINACMMVFTMPCYDPLFCAIRFNLADHQLAPFIDASFFYFCAAKERQQQNMLNIDDTEHRKLARARRHWLNYPHFVLEVVLAEMDAINYKSENDSFRQRRMLRALTEHIIHGCEIEECINHYNLPSKHVQTLCLSITAKLVYCLGETNVKGVEAAFNNPRIELIVNIGRNFKQKFEAIQRIKKTPYAPPILSTGKPGINATGPVVHEIKLNEPDMSGKDKFGRKRRQRTEEAENTNQPKGTAPKAIGSSESAKIERSFDSFADEGFPEVKARRGKRSLFLSKGKNAKTMGRSILESNPLEGTATVKVETEKQFFQRQTPHTIEPSWSPSTELPGNQRRSRQSKRIEETKKEPSEPKKGRQARKKTMEKVVELADNDEREDENAAPGCVVQSAKKQRGRPLKRKSSTEPTSTEAGVVGTANGRIKRRKQLSMLTAEEWKKDSEQPDVEDSEADWRIFVEDPRLAEQVTIERLMEETLETGQGRSFHESHNLMLVPDGSENGGTRIERRPEKNAALLAQWITFPEFWERYNQLIDYRRDVPQKWTTFEERRDDVEMRVKKNGRNSNEDSGVDLATDGETSQSPGDQTNGAAAHKCALGEGGHYANLGDGGHKLFKSLCVSSERAKLCGTVFEIRVFILNILYHYFNADPEPMLSAVTFLCIYEVPISRIARLYSIPADLLSRCLDLVKSIMDLPSLCILADPNKETTANPIITISSKQILAIHSKSRSSCSRLNLAISCPPSRSSSQHSSSNNIA